MSVKKLAFDLFKPRSDKIKLCLSLSHSKTPIVIMHSLFGNKNGWSDIAQTIADESLRTVYTLDARNHGESPRCETGNFVDMANDLELFLNNNNIPKSHLLGHSMGGRSAIVLALTKPQYVESLTAVDISPCSTPEKMATVVEMTAYSIKKAIENISVDLNEQQGKIHLENVLERLKKFDPFTIKMILSSIVKRNDEFICLTNLDCIARRFNRDMFKFPKFNSTFNGPVRFFGVEKSKFLREEDFDCIYSYFPKAQISFIKDSSHQINYHQPKLITDAFSNFLATFKSFKI